MGNCVFVQGVGAGTGLQDLGIANEWLDNAKVPTVVFHTMLEKKSNFSYSDRRLRTRFCPYLFVYRQKFWKKKNQEDITS